MSALTRRRFLATATAFSAARPAVAQNLPGDKDVVIVGAGAAGIAAARRIQAAGRSVAVLEASDHVGGRCVTDTATFGVPFDRGAHWIYTPDINPVAKLALANRTGLDIYPAPPGQKVRIARRYAREGEMESFLSAMVRANRAIGDVARAGKGDVAAGTALPKEFGEWRGTVEFVLGVYPFGRDLGEISAADFAQSAERETAAFCRQGFGTLLTRLAQGVPVMLNTPATQVSWGMRSGYADIETPKGQISCRAVIVTVSTGVLTSGQIKFKPDFPKRQLDAANRLKLGSYDHIAVELAGNPLGLQRDDLVFEKTDGLRTAALLANVSGTSLALVDVGGKFGRELSAKSEADMTAFAVDWLSGLFGSEIKQAVKRTAATRWNADQYALGAMSGAAVGAQPQRKILAEQVGRLFFAGEATHETLWGTVAGAWESGERAADMALKRVAQSEMPRQPERPSKSKRR
jgi:monoamine oxidase